MNILTRFGRALTALGILLAPIGLDAAVTVPHDLTPPVDLCDAAKEWKFRGGDDMAYRDPEYDDRGWAVLPSFPHNWRDPSVSPRSDRNIGWYRLALRFQEVPAGETLMLMLGPIEDADETYFNGVLIGREGVIDASGPVPSKHAVDKIRLYLIPGCSIRPGRDNILAIRIQGVYPGRAGFVDVNGSIVLGDGRELLKKFFFDNLVSFAYVCLIFSIAAFFFHQYVIHRRIYRFLMFFLTGVVFGVFFLMQSQVKFYLSDDFMFLKRLDYITNFTMLYFLMWFIYLMFPKADTPLTKLRKWMVYGSTVIPVISAAVPLLSDDISFWFRYRNYVAQPLWSVPLLLLFWIIIENMLRGSREALYLFIGFTVGMVCLVNDYLLEALVIKSMFLGEFGFLAFLFSLYFSTTHRVHKEYKLTVRLGGLDSAALKKRVDQLMEVDKIYRDDGMNLQKFSEELGIRQDQVSTFINSYYKKNFNVFINGYRVDEAKRLLLDEPGRTIISIAYAVGFNSTTSFQNAFKKFMECSPSEYRKSKADWVRAGIGSVD